MIKSKKIKVSQKKLEELLDYLNTLNNYNLRFDEFYKKRIYGNSNNEQYDLLIRQQREFLKNSKIQLGCGDYGDEYCLCESGIKHILEIIGVDITHIYNKSKDH